MGDIPAKICGTCDILRHLEVAIECAVTHKTLTREELDGVIAEIRSIVGTLQAIGRRVLFEEHR